MVEQSQRTSPNGEEGKYVYCIIRTESPRGFGPIGIGGRGDEVFTVHHREFAAVVSNCPLIIFDPTRENALAHEHVNEIVMKDFTVLPMSFGTVFRTENDIREFLRGTYEALVEVLDKMDGKIEFGLKVNWNKDQVIQELELENDDVRRLKDEISANQTTSTYFARMQLGRVVESALQAKADAYVAEIYEALRDAAIASRSNKPIGDKMIMNAAFLVERQKTKAFDERISEIAKKFENKLSFLYTGPWPPYNFVNIRLKLERAER
ncbi:MAG TPA: GvpL/GvpF family gas vesicle protein [Thermoanaerobaculia bacterium]|nr:GvpL/GvpF family gas vesicle protein [Thermoanaerobaculia bacterium]